jgi:pyrroloquinoline quinone biosynthesis protein B
MQYFNWIKRLLISTPLVCFPLFEFAPAKGRTADPFVSVLGIVQDAGSPHIGCARDCCAPLWNDPSRRRMVSSLVVVDPVSNERWIFDATPDLPSQLEMAKRIQPIPTGVGVTGVFLTHAHIGHYTGLMFLGREGLGAKGIPVYVMPKMGEFLRNHGPWSQLVQLGNIELRLLANARPLQLNSRITVIPLLVPHRDEYAETVGYLVQGPSKSLLYLPDIDKWEKWEKRIEEVIAQVDYAYIDGTFFGDGEIPGRNMKEIPHPFITETMGRLGALSSSEKKKIRFIHLNHSNPVLNSESAERRMVLEGGFLVAQEGERVQL